MRVVLLLLAVTTHLQGQSMGPVSELCMGCLCEASTDCDRNFQCDGRYCGMFRISVPYWRDAGSPVKNGDNAKTVGVFERCVMDPYCAARTVQGYMDRFRKDCNGDKKVDCDDFAQLHYQGAGCEDDTDKEYEQFRTKLHECLAEVAD